MFLLFRQVLFLETHSEPLNRWCLLYTVLDLFEYGKTPKSLYQPKILKYLKKPLLFLLSLLLLLAFWSLITGKIPALLLVVSLHSITLLIIFLTNHLRYNFYEDEHILLALVCIVRKFLLLL